MSQPLELPTEPVIGAKIINESREAQPEKQGLQAQTPQCPLTESPSIQSLPAPTAADFDPHVGAKPCSPFYAHDDNNASLEYLKNETTIAAQKYGSNDLESGIPSTPRKRSLDVHGVRCSKLWIEKKRKCNYLSSLTRKQRLIVKLVLGFLIVGAMIGIAMGITAAVGGGVWKSANVRGNFGR
jgi:hypothetical protein